jgi:hypothetical protein
MALFRRPNGEGVEVLAAPKRAKFRIDREQMRLLRSRTFAKYHLDGFAMLDIARTFSTSIRAVELDIAWLIARQASGLPTDVSYSDPDAVDDDDA